MSLYDAAKDALKVAQKADNVELIQKLLDVQQMALDMQSQIQSLTQDIDAIKKENIELQAALDEKGDFVLENHVYFKVGDNERDQPYCASCMSKGLAIPMRPQNQGTRETKYTCQNQDCKNTANPWDYHPSQIVGSGGSSFRYPRY